MTRPQTRARTTHVRAFAMEYFPSHAGGDRAAFAGKTLVLPAVGHGNVGQLAVDLMIQTLVVDRLASGQSRLGCLDHPSVLPCVGTDAFAPIGGGSPRARATDEGGSQSKVLATALELHGDERVCPGAVFLQLRGDVCVGASKKFANDLASFIESCAFAEVVIAASLPSTAQGAASETVGGTWFRHARGFFSAKETFELATDDRWSRADVPPIEPDSIPGPGPDKKQNAATSLLPPWSLLRAVTRVSPKRDASCLVAVCSEGDNSDDAARAASTLVRFLGISAAGGDALQPERPKLRDGWSVPSSWLGAYGRRAASR
jgi:proteasome assembly chaperone 2